MKFKLMMILFVIFEFIFAIFFTPEIALLLINFMSIVVIILGWKEVSSQY